MARFQFGLLKQKCCSAILPERSLGEKIAVLPVFAFQAAMSLFFKLLQQSRVSLASQVSGARSHRALKRRIGIRRSSTFCLGSNC